LKYLVELLLNTFQLFPNILQCTPGIAERNNKEQEGENLSETPSAFIAILIALVTTKGEFNVDNEEDVDGDKED
jgi:hypothetical protein